eukprot:CAMPEP_0119259144 /NCGR_PEP_ID=MMETSP1329-20130426/82_1 /TAXON_ID=114041 /ORGANISM="Genus nov. species nov., Strain RCC1024" /LENGTH=335 /DNA_ID=CAMNT_0007258509 /DNA_START=20 /DNA_END=1024 /DNA_ORIENTATION=+
MHPLAALAALAASAHALTQGASKTMKKSPVSVPVKNAPVPVHASAPSRSNYVIDCDSVESCEVLSSELQREADALRAEVRLLEDGLQNARNNILPLEEQTDALEAEASALEDAAAAAWKTTLRLAHLPGVLLRLSWEFLEGGAAKVAEVPGKNPAARLAQGSLTSAGWAVRRAGRAANNADVFECWCWVARPLRPPQKLTLRSTCLPAAVAAERATQAAAAAENARALERAFRDAQEDYRVGIRSGWSWLRAMLRYRGLAQKHEAWQIARGVDDAHKSVASSTTGASMTLDGEAVLVGGKGDVRLGKAPGPLREFLGAAFPFLPVARDRGTFSAW